MATREIIYNNHKFSINYSIINPNQKKDLIILHGWGSNKEIMISAFKNHLSEFRHIYIDMPGFGKSPNNIILTTENYANIIEIFLQEISAKKDIIMGHSFGGKVATLMNPKLLVLLSSAGVVIPKPLSIRIKIAIFKILKPFGFANIYKLFASKDVEGMNQKMYETFKNIVDEDFTPHFQNFPNKALLFWGKDDTATPLSSGKKIDSLIKKSQFFSLDGDHYFFIKQANFIQTYINKETDG